MVLDVVRFLLGHLMLAAHAVVQGRFSASVSSSGSSSPAAAAATSSSSSSLSSFFVAILQRWPYLPHFLIYGVVTVVVLPLLVVVLCFDLPRIVAAVLLGHFTPAARRRRRRKARTAEEEETTSNSGNRGGNSGNSSDNEGIISGRRLRVMTFNIQSGVGMDGVVRLERASRGITALRADVVSLQEVEVNTRRSGYRHQLMELAKASDFKYWAYMPARPQDDAGHFGIGILSRYTILETKTKMFTAWPGRQTRGVIAALIEIAPRQSFWFVATHLQNDITGLEQKYQVLSLLKFVDGLAPSSTEVVILAGDFNQGEAFQFPSTWVWLKTCRTLEDHGFVDLNSITPIGPTYPANIPILSLDHIFVKHREGEGERRRVSVAQAGTAPDRLSSDHRPIVAEFVFAE